MTAGRNPGGKILLHAADRQYRLRLFIHNREREANSGPCRRISTFPAHPCRLLYPGNPGIRTLVKVAEDMSDRAEGLRAHAWAIGNKPVPNVRRLQG